MVPEFCWRESEKRYRKKHLEGKSRNQIFILIGNNFVVKAETLNLSGFLFCEMKSLHQVIA